MTSTITVGDYKIPFSESGISSRQKKETEVLKPINKIKTREL